MDAIKLDGRHQEGRDGWAWDDRHVCCFQLCQCGPASSNGKTVKFSHHAQQFVWSFMEGLQVMEVKGSTSSTLCVKGRSGGSVAWRGPGIDLWHALVPDLHKHAA